MYVCQIFCGLLCNNAIFKQTKLNKSSQVAHQSYHESHEYYYYSIRLSFNLKHRNPRHYFGVFFFKRDLIENLRRCHVLFLAGEPDSWIPTPQLAAGKERKRKGKGMRFKDRAKKRWIKKKPRVKTIVDRPKGNTTKSSATRLKVCVYMRYETVSLDKVFYRGRVAPNNICCQLS